MYRTHLSFQLLALTLSIINTYQSVIASSPNFLIILADDCTFSDLSIYGGKNAKTPNIERLASQGLTFNRAYVSAAMCQPCRAELYTGRFPMGNGCAWNHSASRPGIKSLPHYLNPMGYRTGIAGKIHVTPKDCFPFEDVAGFDSNAVRDPTHPHDLAGIKGFIDQNHKAPSASSSPSPNRMFLGSWVTLLNIHKNKSCFLRMLQILPKHAKTSPSI